MREVEELRRQFNARLREAAGGCFFARVETVDERGRTCRVCTGEVTYDQVLLSPATDGLVLVPAEKSTVLVGRIGGSNRLYVAMVGTVGKVLLTIGETDFSVTGDGYVVDRGQAGLKKTLTDLIDAINRLTVTTGVGPSGPPINKADFEKIKQELNDYLC